MKIIITGGYGTLGTQVAKKLVEKDHDVFIADPQGTLEEEMPFEHYGQFLSYRAGMIGPIIESGEKFDRIIHLGETLTTDLHLDPSIVTSNIAESAHILYICAKKNIQCIYPTWQFKPPIHTSLLSMTLHNKSIMPTYYNIANTAIKVLELPMLISLFTPASNLFGIPVRVFNAITLGWVPTTQDYEYLDDITLNWSTIEFAASAIVNSTLESRGRKVECLPSAVTIRATQKEVVQTILDIMNVKEISIIRKKLDPIDIEVQSHHGRLREWLETEIKRATNQE